MAKANRGTTNMDKQEDAPKTELGATAKNEFAPNIVAGKQVDPAPSPEASMKPLADPELVAAVEEDAAPSETEFLAYVHGELTRVAADFGYDLTVKKRNAATGPVMMYHRESLEGKVFGAREEAGPDYMTGDELQEHYANAAAE